MKKIILKNTNSNKWENQFRYESHKEEEENYVKMPTYYSFIDKTGKDRKEETLMANYRRITKEVELIIKENMNP